MGEQKNKRQRFSQNGEGSGRKKSSVVALACSPGATVAPAALAPSPVAMAKPAATVAETTPLAVMSPAPASPTVVDLEAPSSAAVVTQDATVEDLVVTSPVAAMAPAPAAPGPVPVATVKPDRVVKPEEEGAEVAEQEHGAMVVEEEKELVNLYLPKTVFHCAACPGPLRPPVFKCENEHFVCHACGGRGDGDGNGGGADKHCIPCGRDVNYTHSRLMDVVVDAYKVACPYNRLGCARSMAYHSAADHAGSCRHAPCYCFDCRFEGSPANLVRHLTARSGQHSWPVEKIEYEVAKPFVVPASSEDQSRLLVADDGRVFLLAVGAGRDPGGRRPVNVVCVRGNARPLYTGVLWVDGPPAAPGQPLTSSFQLKATVASCSVPGEVDMEQGWLHAHVNPNMLHGESGEVHLRLCLTKLS